ncbi:MAG TPA: hypothetical protein VED16_00450 [Candidatus Acidoferrum sp.]|nr:hypothetical protein [Candidatus Acidoferrum sp.]
MVLHLQIRISIVVHSALVDRGQFTICKKRFSLCFIIKNDPTGKRLMSSKVSMIIEATNCSTCGATIAYDDYITREELVICDKCAIKLGYVDALAEETKLLRKTKRTGFRRAFKTGVFQRE